MDLSNLPHDVLLEVFRICPQSDRIRARRLNRKMHKVLTSRAAPKPIADEFKISVVDYEDRTVPLGRLNLKKSEKTRRVMNVWVKRKERREKLFEDQSEPGSSNEKDRLAVHEVVERQLDQIKIGSRLSFDGGAMCCDSNLLQSLLLNDLRSVSTLSFTMCHIRWTDAEFSQLLSRMNPNELIFDFCHFHTELLTDKVFTNLPSLKSLSVQARGHSQFGSLTDETLQYWKANLPSTIRLSNVTTGFTLAGIHDFVKNLSSDRSFDLDLGMVLNQQSVNECLGRLMFLSNYVVNISDDYCSRRITLHRLSRASEPKTIQRIGFSVLTPQMSQ